MIVWVSGPAESAENDKYEAPSATTLCYRVKEIGGDEDDQGSGKV